MLSSIAEFIGHLHPLLVHLPIGILLLGLLLMALSQRPTYAVLEHALSVIWLLGALTALLSATTGYLLSLSDDYERTLVNWHMWVGFGVVITSFLLYARQRNLLQALPSSLLPVILFVLIMITGHLGGSLTHGTDYLTGPMAKLFSNDSTLLATIQPLGNVQEAVAFRDVVQPILQTKCYGCHGPGKQKGGLRMDDSLALIKGGKDGKVINPFHADESEIMRRLMLPVDDEDHMPPKEKPQPTENQIALVHWWISQGAAFTKKVNELVQPDRIKPVLLALAEMPDKEKESTGIPKNEVGKADEKVIGQLRAKGILVLPIARNTNYLMANLVTNTLLTDEEVNLLPSLKKQLLVLKLGYTNVTDKHMTVIGKLINLTRLSLEHTIVSDEGIAQLHALQNLEYLNLVGTKVTAQGIMQLKGLKSLQTIYLYQTNIAENEWATLKSAFPATRIERGGYVVPTMTGDTTVVTPK